MEPKEQSNKKSIPWGKIAFVICVFIAEEVENIVSEIGKNPLIEPYIAHVQGIVASRANARLRYKK